MLLLGPLNSGDTAGGAGASTANADTPTVVKGLIMGVYVKYNGSPPAGTTDVTIATKGTSPEPPSYNIIAITNAATDGWFYPRINIHDTSAAEQSSNWDYIPVSDYINIDIAQADDDDSIDVWFLLA